LILPWVEDTLPEEIPDEDEVPLSSSNSPRVSSDFGLRTIRISALFVKEYLKNIGRYSYELPFNFYFFFGRND
jgi:hypothetical protein